MLLTALANIIAVLLLVSNLRICEQPGRESMNVQVDKQLRENLLAEDQKQNFQHQIGSSSQIRAGKNVSINGTTK